MKPTRLTCQNYRCLSDLDWTIDEGATAIVGVNGAGKSSRLLAIEHCLFGVRSRSFAPLLKRGETEMAISLEFEHGQSTYRVRRGYSARGAGKTWVTIDQWHHDGTDWEPLTRETASETQAAINDLLGLSRETYRASAYSPQDDGSAWTAADPAERKRILAEIIALGQWDDYHAEAKRRRQDVALELEPLREQARDLANAEASMASASQALGEARAAELLLAGREEGLAARIPALQLAAREAHTAAAQAESRVEAAKEAKLRRDQALAQYEALDARGNEARRHLQGVEQASAVAGDLHRLELDREAAIRSNDALATEYREAQSAYAARVQASRDADLVVSLTGANEEAAAIALQDRLMRLAQASGESAECPTCHQALAGEHQRATLADLREQVEVAKRDDADAQAASRAAWEACEEKRAAVGEAPPVPFVENTERFDAQIAEARSAAQLVAAADGWREHLRQADAALREMDDVTLPALEQAVQETERAAATVPGAQAALHAAERALQEATTEDAELRRKRTGAASEVARLTAELDQAQERARASKEAGARAVELEQSLNVLLLLERGYGKDGVPSLIVETVALPAIQTEANRVLDRLDSPFRVDLRSQKTTKAGDTRDTLDIVIHTPTGEALYESLSGGEASRVDIALRFGLSRLLASRRGAEVGIFAIDEPSGLDQDGADRLAVLLKEAAREVFGRVVLVSHQDGLRDALDQTIIVAGEASEREVVAA